jgi:hypothetical protein
LGFAPTDAQRNEAIGMLQRQQRRLRAAMNCLLADAANARAVNPDLYESLIPRYNDLVGARGAYYEQQVWSSPEADTGVYAALATFTGDVEDFVGGVRRLTNCDAAVAAAGGEGGITPSAPGPTPAPPESLLQPEPAAPPEPTAPPAPTSTPTPGSGDVPVLTPVVTPPRRPAPTSGFPSWTYYAFAGAGVLLVASVVGFFVFKRRRNGKGSRRVEVQSARITPKSRRLTAGKSRRLTAG